MSERSAGWSGILCIVVVAIALFLPGYPLPSATDSGRVVGAFLDAHRGAWLLGAWLTFPETVFFSWFVLGLRKYLGRAFSTNEGLMLYMLAGAFGAVAAGLVGTTLQILLGIVPASQLGPAPIKAFYVGWLACVPVVFMSLAAMLFAAAHGMRRRQLMNGWLAGIGYVAALLYVLVTSTVFFSSGPMALNGPVAYIAFFAFALWTVLASLHLIFGLHAAERFKKACAVVFKRVRHSRLTFWQR